MLLGEIITRAKERFPSKTAISFKEQTWTYTELDEHVNQVANGLQKLGLKKGDRVGLLMLNSPYFVMSYFAIVRLGAVVVPINVAFKGDEVKYLLNDSQASLMVVAPAFLPMITQIRGDLNTVRDVVVVDMDKPAEVENVVSFKGFIEAEVSTAPAVTDSFDEEEVVVFLYTSGTTGHPKGAMLTHKNLFSNAVATAEATCTTDKDNTLCILPMFHSFAWTCCVMVPLVTGGTITVMDSFVPQSVLQTIIKEHTTVLAFVPTMYSVLLQVPQVNPDDFKHLRLPYSGGAALPVEVLQSIGTKYGIDIVEGYGLSECSPVASLNPVNGVKKPGSIGIALPGVEIKIFNDLDEELPPNSPGELVLRGPNVMKGYFNLPEATNEALRGGWLHTGDIAYMDEEGYIFIVDRKKDLIIVGGLNVYPREIEEVIYQHPKVAEAAVIGVADALRGEMVKAFIALKEGEAATEREIIKFCQDKLANFKLPKVVEFIDALPKTSTGKILKRALKK